MGGESKRGEAFDWFIRHAEVGRTTSSQRAQHIPSPTTSEEVDSTSLLETRRESYERLFSSIGELRHEQRLRLLHVGRYVSVYVAQRAQQELWTEWMHNTAPVSHSPSIRRERQDIIGAVDHVSGDAAKLWIGQRLDDDLRSDSGGITHAQSHDGAVVGLGCVAHLHIVSAT